ncbi:MAG: MFS transporter [Bacillota bacterium]
MSRAEIAYNESVINKTKHEEPKLRLREKIACSIGGLTGTLHFQMISMFLLFFYTDVMKIPPAYVAGLFLVARIIDAVLAPMFGIFVDKVTTPWGKYKPWMLILGIPTAIFGWLTFTSFDLSHTGKIIYATVTYLAYSIMIAITPAPSSAIMPAVTKRVDDRVSIGTYSYMLVMVGAMFVTIAAQPLYKALGGGSDARGFSLLMLVVGIITILVSLFQVLNLKERYIVTSSKDEARPSLKEMLVAVFTNKNAIIVYIYVLALNLANGIRSAVMVHYFKYFFGNEGLVVTVGIVSILPVMIGAVLSPMVTKKIGVKANVLLGTFVTVLSMLAILVIPSTPAGIIAFLVIGVISGVFTGFSSPAQGTMLPAAMDYTEWKTGINVNAFMGSFLGFLQTFATALSGAIAAGVLVMIGYEPGVEQSSTTLTGLKILMGVIPAIVIVFTASVAWFDLTEEKQKQIAKDLEERRNQRKND